MTCSLSSSNILSGTIKELPITNSVFMKSMYGILDVLSAIIFFYFGGNTITIGSKGKTIF